MGYFLQAVRVSKHCLGYRVIDTRGPWFLGGSPLRIGLAAAYLAGALCQLAKASTSSGPCGVHANITGRGSTVRKVILLGAARVLGLRYLLHVHDYNYAEEYRRRGALMKSLIASIFRRAEKIVVLGSRDQELLSSLMRLPQHQIAVMPNAVPDPLPVGPSDNCHRRACHLLFLGHLSARKGVPELLRALSYPALISRKWRATLAGDGAVAEFRRLAVEFGIAERVDFPGWVDEGRVRGLFSEADVVVLPSHAEGLAMSVLEGLAHGLTVITTPVGAHSEVIDPEVSGLLVAPGDVDALAQALVRVIDDDQLRSRLGAGARQRYLEKFDVRGYAERLSELHARVLLEPRPLASLVNQETSL
jgi:glycosyltransferase involved in cell wall biosynthesis